MKIEYNKLIKNRSGFTMIEIVAVLVILGILVAVAAPRVGGIIDTTEDTATGSSLKSHLRYAQIRALNTQGVWGIAFNGNINYSLYSWDGSSATTVTLPGEDAVNVPFPSGVNHGLGTHVSFDDWGIPYSTQGATGNSTAISGSIGGENITITQETGYIP